MKEQPFFPDPGPQDSGGLAPAALFDLAVNRAANTLRALAPSDPQHALGLWHARTRFARRIPLADIVAALAHQPAGKCRWVGGKGGGWEEC